MPKKKKSELNKVKNKKEEKARRGEEKGERKREKIGKARIIKRKEGKRKKREESKKKKGKARERKKSERKKGRGEAKERKEKRRKRRRSKEKRRGEAREKKKKEGKMYDVIVIGAGPAGLTAALYLARYKLKTLVIGKTIGGKANYATIIENYPGFFSISGIDFIKKIQEQVEALGVKIVEDEVNNIEKENNFTVYTKNEKYQAKAIILALGTERKKLNLPEENKFIGKGVSYCATCDAPLFKDKIVAVIGGGNSAVIAALILTKYAKKVYIIYRGSQLKAETINVEKIKNNKKIEIIYNAEIKKILGDNFVSGIQLNNKQIKVDGIFIEIGNAPSDFFIKISKKLGIKTNNEGFIITNNAMETNVNGLFAAGDIVDKPLRQIVTAAADGAVAAFSVYNYLKSGSSKSKTIKKK